MDNRELTWAVLTIAIAATLIGRMIARHRTLSLRRIPAYVVLPEMAADAVESDYQIHFSLGSSGVGQLSTVAALASAELVYRLTQRLAIARHSPIITLSDPVTLPLAHDTLRRAYEYRQRLDSYHTTAAIWFPQGARSLAFAAGASSLAADIDASSNVLLGRFGVETALLGESSLRHDQALIVHSDHLQGQAIAYAQADHVLLGEELYAGAAYMHGRAVDMGTVIAMDFLRWLVILGILAAALQAL